MPFWSALAQWAPAIGSVVGGLLDSQSQASANAANWRIAQAQMDFQERMSNTQWQRGVKDMVAAGLSPMLAYSQGPASSPAGASAHMESRTGGRASQMGLAAGMSLAQRELIEAQTRTQNEQTRQLKIENDKKAFGLAGDFAPGGVYSGGSAAMELKKLSVEVDKLVQESSEAKYGALKAKFDYETMLPLAKKAAELVNQKMQLGMSLAQAESELWTKLEGEGRAAEWMTKFLLAVKQLLH